MNHLRRFKSVRAAQTETQIYGWTDRPEAKEAPPTVERSVDAWGTVRGEREVPPGYEFSALSQRLTMHQRSQCWGLDGAHSTLRRARLLSRSWF